MTMARKLARSMVKISRYRISDHSEILKQWHILSKSCNYISLIEHNIYALAPTNIVQLTLVQLSYGGQVRGWLLVKWQCVIYVLVELLSGCDWLVSNVQCPMVVVGLLYSTNTAATNTNNTGHHQHQNYKYQQEKEREQELL